MFAGRAGKSGKVSAAYSQYSSRNPTKSKIHVYALDFVWTGPGAVVIASRNRKYASVSIQGNRVTVQAIRQKGKPMHKTKLPAKLMLEIGSHRVTGQTGAAWYDTT